MAKKEKPQRSIFVVIFGAFFALIGGTVFVLIAREYIATVGTYGWEKVPAEIASIDIDYPKQAPKGHDDNVFELTTNYEYEVAGKKYQGTAFRLKPCTSDDYHRLADRKYGMIRDEVQSAFVDPNDPNKAILERASLWSGWMVLFPIPFLLIGLGLMAAGLGWFSNVDLSGRTKTKSFASEAKNSRLGGCGIALFGSVFFAFGLGFLFPLLITPLVRSSEASEWKETPCTVIWSRVSVHTGEDSDTYSPDVFYEYDFNGETHRSNQYSFLIGSSSGRKAKREIVRKYPAGHKATCFVDPVQPWRAVINRDKGQVGFWWLLPTIFLVVGGAIIAAGLVAWKKPAQRGKKRPLAWHDKRTVSDASLRESRPRTIPSPFLLPQPSEQDFEESRVFRSAGSRLLTFVGSTLIAAFWNGIAVVLFGKNILRFVQGAGDVDVFLLVFSIPFVLIGAVILFAVVYSFGGLFNPYVTLRVSPSQPQTGQEVIVDWNLSGGWSRISQLRITIEGVEEATYRRGTDTIIDDETFYRQLLVEETDPESIRSGSVVFEVPLGALPSLSLIDNRIAWQLSVEGDVRFWPNVFEIHELEIFPFATSTEVKVSV